MPHAWKDIHVGPSRFNYSTDKGKSRSGPYHVPDFGQKGIAARTDYLVNGERDALIFRTARQVERTRGPRFLRAHP